MFSSVDISAMGYLVDEIEQIFFLFDTIENIVHVRVVRRVLSIMCDSI